MESHSISKNEAIQLPTSSYPALPLTGRRTDPVVNNIALSERYAGQLKKLQVDSCIRAKTKVKMAQKWRWPRGNVGECGEISGEATEKAMKREIRALLEERWRLSLPPASFCELPRSVENEFVDRTFIQIDTALTTFLKKLTKAQQDSEESMAGCPRPPRDGEDQEVLDDLAGDSRVPARKERRLLISAARKAGIPEDVIMTADAAVNTEHGATK